MDAGRRLIIRSGGCFSYVHDRFRISCADLIIRWSERCTTWLYFPMGRVCRALDMPESVAAVTLQCEPSSSVSEPMQRRRKIPCPTLRQLSSSHWRTLEAGR
jgi:hypothetical protein